MGATQSSTKTSIDVANSFVSSVTVQAITKNTTTATGSQSINISCSDDAFRAAVAACSADTKNRNEIVALVAQTNPSLALSMSKATPESCTMCSAEDISMDMNVSISTEAIADNSIANQIKSDMSSKLQEAIDNSTKGGIGMTDTQIEATTKLKNYVETNFDTKVVNETLNTYTFSQDLKSTNASIRRINMKLVGSAVGSAVVRSAMANDSKVKGWIETATSVKTTTKGTEFPSLFGGIGSMFMSIAIGIVGMIILVILLKMKSGSGASVTINPTVPVVGPMNLPTGLVSK